MTWVDRYRRLKSPVRPFVRRHWRHPILAGGARLARRYLAVYENTTHDLQVNGEAEVIRRLAPFRPRVVMDVGAFEGNWTRTVLETLPDTAVHAVEPSPEVADALTRRVSGSRRVSVHRCALSDHNGRATLHVHREDASLTSLVPSDPAVTTPMTVPVRRGDDLLAELGVDRLDMVKVDAEGHDLAVLRGFERTLATAAVTVVQFEYNTWNIRSRSLLFDFYELLEPCGYRLGKVHPDGVDFRNYDTAMENWVGPACVAVHRDHPEVIAALSVGSSPGRRGPWSS